jgi:peroxiredoxin
MQRKHSKDVMVVSINVDTHTQDRTFRFLHDRESFTELVDEEWLIAKQYGVSVLPATFVIDMAGRISYCNIGWMPRDAVALDAAISAAARAEDKHKRHK